MNPNFYQGNAVETHLFANQAEREPSGFHKSQIQFTSCLVNRIFRLVKHIAVSCNLENKVFLE